jgi:NhaA family Na+:H+ antiporter
MPVTGVLLAFVIPFGDGSKSLFRINCKVFTQTCSFLLPLFALANTAIVIGADIVETLTQHYSMEIALGLVIETTWNCLFSFLALQQAYANYLRI